LWLRKVRREILEVIDVDPIFAEHTSVLVAVVMNIKAMYLTTVGLCDDRYDYVLYVLHKDRVAKAAYRLNNAAGGSFLYGFQIPPITEISVEISINLLHFGLHKEIFPRRFI